MVAWTRVVNGVGGKQGQTLRPTEFFDDLDVVCKRKRRNMA